MTFTDLKGLSGILEPVCGSTSGKYSTCSVVKFEMFSGASNRYHKEALGSFHLKSIHSAVAKNPY